jgi:hypothetical protein
MPVEMASGEQTHFAAAVKRRALGTLTNEGEAEVTGRPGKMQ